mmetsp:Transcript_124659/g.399373  ORF Transcript_124659/g.399373 Transcript_124659/m.399373 type:complete len:972 (-) Transcript_124659:83-2998(-)
MKFSATLAAFVLGSLAVVAVAAAVEPARSRNGLSVDGAEPSSSFSMLRGARGAAELLLEDGESLAERTLSTARRADYTMWIIGGCVVVAIAAIVGGIAVVIRRRSGDDSSVVLHVTFDVPAGKFQAFKDNLRSFYDAIQPAAEGLLYYGFTLDEDGGKVVCKEAYKDAAGVLEHLENVDACFQKALSIGTMHSIEALGPDVELEKLKPKLTDLGCKFYASDSGCKLHGATIPKVWSNRAIDTSCTIRMKFKVPEGRLDEFVATFPDFYRSIDPETEVMLNFGFAVDKENSTVVSHESYKDAAGLLLHLENVDAPFKKALEIASLESVEAHGPVNDLVHLKSALDPLGCQFFFADPNCKTWTWAGGDLSAMQDKEMCAGDVFATSAKKMFDQFQEKMEVGSRAREIVEKDAMGFQEKAKVFLINELNTTAHALLKAVDEEEASMLLEFNRSLEASFPPVSVLIAGMMSPAILSMSVVGHFVQLFGLFLPIAIGTGLAAWEDMGSHCDIPSLTGWTYFTFVITFILVLSHGNLGMQIWAGRKALEAKTSEISKRLADNAADGDISISDIQEIFIGSTVLVQEALLLEDSVKRSPWRTLIGPCTLLWMIAVIWNFVLVVGWTFVPGQISFYLGASDASAGAFCGSWASVFVARIVVLITPFFFFINVFACIQWLIQTLLNSDTVSSSVLSAAQDFDKQNTGIPVVEILLKAFLLRGSTDVSSARLTVALGEALRLSKEQQDLEGQLNEVECALKNRKIDQEVMEAAAKKCGGDMQENLAILAQVGDDDHHAWKEQGKKLALKASEQARVGGSICTEQLEAIQAYVQELAEKIQDSEMYKEAVETARRASEEAKIAAVKAAEEAAKAAAAAQEMATEGLAQAQDAAKAGFEYAQSDEVQAALAEAQGMAKDKMAKAQAGIEQGVAYAQSEEAQAALQKAAAQAQSSASAAAAQAQAGASAAASQVEQAAMKKGKK